MSAWLWMSLLACGPEAAAEPVGVVLLATGPASLRAPTGNLRPATSEAPIARDDTVVTAEGGLVVLRLANGHLVRIDEDLTLPVARIVVLDAPPATVDAVTQLQQLVEPGERVPEPTYAEAERVAGAHGRLAAAKAPGPAHSAARNEAASVASPAAPLPPPPPPPPPAPAATQVGASSPSKPGAAAPGSSAAVAAPAGARADEQQVPAEPTREAPLTQAEVASVLRGELGTCVRTWADGLPVRLRSVEVIVRADHGRITRVLFDGGLAVPACVRDALVGRPLAGAELTSFTLSVAIR